MRRAALAAGIQILILFAALLAAPPALAGNLRSAKELPAGVAEALARREYEASANARGLQAPNRAHGLRTYFEPGGVRVHDRTAQGSPELLRLTLAGVGRGAELAPVAAGELVHAGARVEIRRPGLVEWFVNSEAGLEQGFTLAERPAGAGALVLELRVDGSRAELDGERIVFTSAAGRRLEYAKLAVRDASGRALPARFELPAPGRLRIAFDDAGARYPIEVDPLLTETSDAVLQSNQAGVQLGASLAVAGDVNGDGYADVIVGVPYYDAGEGFGEGAAFVFLGGATGIASGSPASAAARLESDQAGAQMGLAVAGAGDVNGDGYADVIVGAPNYDAGEGAGEGAAFVFLGGFGGVANGSPSSAGARLESDQDDALMGYAVAGAGDVNGDGYADVIVGAHGYDTGSGRGAAFVFHGGSGGVVNGDPSTAATGIESDQPTSALGISVSGAGDVNADGYADVIIGAPSYDSPTSDEGAAFVFLGEAGGIASGPPASADARLESNQAQAEFGRSVAGAGDVNGDGYADVIVGAPSYEDVESTEGTAFVFLGGSGGITDGSPASAATRLEANQSDALLGISVAGAGDVDGDGYADVLVGASLYDAGETDEGAVFVFRGGAGGIPNGGPASAYAQLESQLGGARLHTCAPGGDVNGDGYADVLAGAPLYDLGENNEGAAFVYYGGAQGIVDGSPTTAAAQLEADRADSALGYSVADAGDVNGDSYSDLIVGVPRYDASVLDEGLVLLFHGGPSGIANGNPGNASHAIQGTQASAIFGASVASAGDVNGDGYGDVIVGAPQHDDGQLDEGAAFLFLGSPSGITASTPAGAAAVFSSDQASAEFGYGVAGADVDGDGFSDLVISSVYYDAGEQDEGAVFVFHAGAGGIAGGTPASAAAQLESNLASSHFGVRVASAGDVNGDGYADVIVGQEFYSDGQVNEGAVYLFEGGASGIPDGNPGTADTELEGDSAGAFFGSAVSGAGDVNGDGFADVIVGAWGVDAGETDEGAAYVFHGGAAGIADHATPATAIQGNQADAQLGYSVGRAGDVNGDGYADVIVGGRGLETNETFNDEGAALVFLGSADGVKATGAAGASARLESDQQNARMGWSVSGAGDVNGDGYADVIAGAPSYAASEVGEGAAFVFYGNGNRTGRLVWAGQRRPESSRRVQPWSSSYGEGFDVSMRRGDPRGPGTMKLEVQWCPPGVPFGQVSCGGGVSPSWTDDLTQKVDTPALTDGALYRWRARLLFAPSTVTQSGITPPPNPAHGPWRRLFGQAFEADIRVGLDTDLDGLRNSVDPDDDDDGLPDLAEGTAGTDPLDADSDDDGLLDGPEVALGTDPLDEDTDGDLVCDGGAQVGVCTAVGPDNCPFIANPSQQNGDAYAAGDDCQCGDVTGDGLFSPVDYTRARELVAGRSPSGASDPDRCDVTGDAACGVDDLAVLDRLASGAAATIVYGCEAYIGP